KERHDTAAKIALPSRMTERVISAGIFNLTVWEHVSRPDAPVNIYIEGDGLAWLDSRTKSMNPTPPDPLALRLAALDKADNMIYMARPCQYTGLSSGGACPDIYWTNGRTAPEVIRAYMLALDNIKTLYHVTGFNLIGYSGGAAVAMLVAAERTDILSLRTVAGNTDYATFSAFHSVSPMDASINPINVATKVALIPQLHFIGEKDTIIPHAIFNSWKQASAGSLCVQSIIVPENTHKKGWVEKWPKLLDVSPACTNK
ncbi:MAG: alpha/beta hydrolase, partial [Alphaproteobacteria bacterium]|nr:alpha/beta hydrolase [Alphaproteobacteria bacterium]